MIKTLLKKLKPEPAELAALREAVAQNDEAKKQMELLVGQRATLETALVDARTAFSQNPSPETLAKFVEAGMQAERVRFLNEAQHYLSAAIEAEMVDRTMPAVITALEFVVARLNAERDRQDKVHTDNAASLELSNVGGSPISEAINRKIAEASGLLAKLHNDDTLDTQLPGIIGNAVTFCLQ